MSVKRIAVYCWIVLAVLLAACAPGATPSAIPATPSPVDVDAVRTQAVGTALDALTQEASIWHLPTQDALEEACSASHQNAHIHPNWDTSSQGYFLGIVAISEYYTLLNAGLQEDAYRLLSPAAQKASPREQYVQAARRNLKVVQVVTAEPLRFWQERQGNKHFTLDLENRINFYVQIRVSGTGNTPVSSQSGELQTLYLTLVLTEPEHAWKIDRFATTVPADPSPGPGTPPVVGASLSDDADQSYYDALAAIGRYYTLIAHGFYEQAEPLYSSSHPHPGLPDNIQSSKPNVEQILWIVPIYPSMWELICETPTPEAATVRHFLENIYAYDATVGEVRPRSYFIDMILENGEWKIYSINTGG